MSLVTWIKDSGEEILLNTEQATETFARSLGWRKKPGPKPANQTASVSEQPTTQVEEPKDTDEHTESE